MSSDPDLQPPVLEASFYDGQVPRAHQVQLRIGGDGVVLSSPCLRRDYAWKDTSVSERLRHAPRLVRFADGSHCEIADHAGMDTALAAAGYRDTWVAGSRYSRRYAAIATLWLVAMLFAIYRWALPIASDFAARRVPPPLEQRIGVQASKIVEQEFPPTRLSGAQTERAWRVFDSIAPQGQGRDFRLVLRDGGAIGANAFALPGGTVVVTDQLLELSPDDAALAGVLAHEIGHIENRHVLRQAASSAMVGAVVTLIAGDVSGLAAGLPAVLADLSYSRDMEREADAYAVDLLKSKGIPIGPFADFLQRLQTAHGSGSQPRWARYLQTHPDTEARIAAIRAAQP